MKNLVKTLLLILVLLVSLITPQITNSYEFESSEKKENAILIRDQIYDLYKVSKSMANEKEEDTDKSKYGVVGYNGARTNVTVNGKTIPLDKYIAGVIKQEMGGNNIEALKAQAIAARSFLLGTHINASSCSVTNGQSYQAYTDASDNDIYTKAAKETSNMVVSRKNKIAVTQYQSHPAGKWWTDDASGWHVKFQRFNDDKSTEWTWNAPVSKEEVQKTAGDGYKYGTDMDYNNDHHYGMSQTIAMYLAKADNYSYDKIIKLFYNEPIVKISDGVYDKDVKYVDGSVGKVMVWYQIDYPNVSYGYGCGSIAQCACGPTSVGIIASTFNNKAINPPTATKTVCSNGGCSSGGTYFDPLAKTLNKNFNIKTKFESNKQKVINALGTGDVMVIALMGSGYFTRGGHYIVLTGVNSKGQVSVADPASKKNTEKIKWFSFNLIESQRKAAYLIACRPGKEDLCK